MKLIFVSAVIRALRSSALVAPKTMAYPTRVGRTHSATSSWSPSASGGTAGAGTATAGGITSNFAAGAGVVKVRRSVFIVPPQVVCKSYFGEVRGGRFPTLTDVVQVAP